MSRITINLKVEQFTKLELHVETYGMKCYQFKSINSFVFD